MSFTDVARSHARAVRLWLAALALMPVATLAVGAEPPSDPELEQLRDRVLATLPDLHRDDIRRSPAPGLFEVRSDNAFGYVTADGRYLVSGDVIDLNTGERITERRRDQARLEQIGRLSGGGIEFAPPPENIKRWIVVFTDVDCEYCRLLHKEVPELNRRGVGVRYLFFSKYGAPSKAFDRAQQVWCDADRHDLLNADLLSGELPAKKPRSLCKNPVMDQYQAAVHMGLRGTPIAVLPDGSLFSGYARAAELIDEMDKREAAAAGFSPQVGAAP